MFKLKCTFVYVRALYVFIFIYLTFYSYICIHFYLEYVQLNINLK